MAEILFGYVSTYGLPIIAIAAFLSCLAVPIPTFAVMLAGGAFAASSDLTLWQVIFVAYVAAISGDQVGFNLGRWGGPAVVDFLRAKPQRDLLVARAQSAIERWGGIAVFLSTWLFAPLGPWVNLTAGAAGMSWVRFSVWDAVGEAIWVFAYVMIGFLFGSRLSDLADLVGDWSGLISSAGVAVILGTALVRRVLHQGQEK
jgi:membrane protein DedA with SNARE-associated domain